MEALKKRAAQHGRSAEAEHRELLRTLLLATLRSSFKQHLLAMPPAGEDADFEPPRERARLVDL